jgi:hypothetical protein
VRPPDDAMRSAQALIHQGDLRAAMKALDQARIGFMKVKSVEGLEGVLTRLRELQPHLVADRDIRRCKQLEDTAMQNLRFFRNPSHQLQEAPDVVIQRCAIAIAGASGYTMNSAGTNVLVATRRRTPKWPIVLVVLGAVEVALAFAGGTPAGSWLGFVMIVVFGGLLAFRRKTETLTITAEPAEDGRACLVSISGRATPEVTGRISALLANPRTTTPQQEVSTKTCPDCAEEVKAAAQVCRFCGYRFATDPAVPESPVG